MFINNILSNIYVYQYCENLANMGVSSRAGVISAIYKKGDKEDIYCKLQTHLTHLWMQQYFYF